MYFRLFCLLIGYRLKSSVKGEENIWNNLSLCDVILYIDKSALEQHGYSNGILNCYKFSRAIITAKCIRCNRVIFKYMQHTDDLFRP